MSSRSKKIVNTDSSLHKSELSNSFPWSEWSDSELNAEPWDYPKSGEFSDPQQIVMPRSLQPTNWKRFRDLEFVDSPVVYETISNYPDLITNNRHLLHSDFIRCFVSTLINIQYYGRNGLEVDNRTSNFSWNMGGQCWQGWFNVYSLNKAGKGASHRPVINPHGRYIVRIFYMGCWRKILVDDSIPLDKSGRPLLPRTVNGNELWPLILAKAMLKVAALSWTHQREIVDCSLITCLTGWIGLSLNVSHLSPRDQWNFLTKYAKHFEWPQEEKMETDQTKSDETKKSAKSQKSKTKVTKVEVLDEPQPTVLFLNLEDMKDADANEIPGISPCWNHQIYVELSRDVPLDPAQVKPPLAKWKIHRWLDWAIRRGLADASEYFLPTRHLLIVSPLRECNEDFSYAYEELEELNEEDSSRMSLRSREKKIVKPQSTIKELSKGKSETVEMPDISLWGDFNKLSFYLREVELFYRQNFFKYTIRMSNSVKTFSTNDGIKGKIESSSKEVKKSARKSSERPQVLEEIYEYQDKVWQSRNEPLYLFVDSVDEKFFLVNFSTIRDTLDYSEGKNSSLIIERHNLFKIMRVEKSVARLKTRGTKSMVFQLEPGRHLLRIFINYESSYHAIIVSDTPFQIGDRSKMHKLMTMEAHRLNEIGRKISNGVKKAFKSFGTDNYMNDLNFFRQSYMPESSRTLEKKYEKVLKSINDWFIEDFLNLVKEQFSPVDFPAIRRAMRIFFMDPSIGVKMKINHSSNNDEDEDSWENEEDDWEINRNAMIIQSFFRMAVKKNYNEIHKTSHEEHNSVKMSLWRVVEIFNQERQEPVINSLLRAIVKHDESLEIIYPWAKDLDHVIQIQEIIGQVTSFTTDRWFPIVRIFVNTEKFKTVFASVDLLANFSNYKVRVFENDTNQEIFCLVNNVTPNNYRYKKNGYTIFAYGWNDSQKYKELDWSLHLTTIKYEANFRWINETEVIPIKSEIQPLLLQEISGIYVPNKNNNCIFKLIVKVKKSCIISLRSRMSYEKVLTKLRVVKENGQVLSEIEGDGILIQPFVSLEFDIKNEPDIVRYETEEKLSKRRKSSSRKSGGSVSQRSGNVSRSEMIDNEIFDKFTCYSIEAFVRENSWPLTAAEWAVAIEAKSKKFGGNSRVKKSSTNGRKSERLRNLTKKSLQLGKTLEEPYWSLQIVTDRENELEILNDTRREDKIEELKKIWKTEELRRSERGRKLQENFLESHFSTNVPSAIDSTVGMTRSSDEYEEISEIFYSESTEIWPFEKRTLEPPKHLANYLPKLDLTIYMIKEDEEEDRWVKLDYDEETLRNQRAMNVFDFEQLQANFLDKSSEVMEKRSEMYRQMTQRYLENRANCKRDIDEAYDIRQAFIDSTKDTTKSVKSKDNIKQKKKSQK